jgi:hypothetical protein
MTPTTDPELGELLSTRVLTLITDSDATAEVKILVGYPRRSDLDPYYEISYRFTGIGNGMVKRSHGVDPLDAIANVIRKMGYDLHAFPEARAGRLYWLEPGDDLGLPDLPPEAGGGRAG